jgi:hypothetical protein
MLLAEEGSEHLSKETEGAELLSSVLLILEARRNLVRLAREGALKAEQYKTCIERVEQDTSLFVLRDLTLDRQSSLLPAVTPPIARSRASPVCTLVFQAARIDRFVTMDGSQNRQQRLGLPVRRDTNDRLTGRSGHASSAGNRHDSERRDAEGFEPPGPFTSCSARRRSLEPPP